MNIKEKISEIERQFEEIQQSMAREEAVIENAKENINSMAREIYIIQGKHQILKELDAEGCEDTDI